MTDAQRASAARSPGPARDAHVPEVPGIVVRREIGHGPRGDVYEARAKHRAVALKVYRRDASVDRAFLERFVRNAPQAIRHPHIVPIDRIGETKDGRLYHTQPLLVGDSLEIVIADLKRGSADRPSLSPLSVGPDGALHPELPRYATELVAGVAAAVARVHREGCIHGHLSPSNLHLSPAGRLLVSGFGSALRGDEEDPAPSYRAPEQLEGAPEDVGPAADVYALGAVLYTLLCRREPAVGSCVEAPRCLNSRVSPELESAILRALERDPSRRYADAGDFEEDLRRVLRGETPLAARPEHAIDSCEAAVPEVLDPHATATPVAVGHPRATTRDLPKGIDRPRARARTPRRVSWRRRTAVACALVACVALAYLGGKRLRTEQAAQEHEGSVVSLVDRGDYDQALAETQKLRALDPGRGTVRLLQNYAGVSAALRSLKHAVAALDSRSVSEAAEAIAEARTFRPDDSQLDQLAVRLRDRSQEDPVALALEDDDPSTRAGVLYRLHREILAGARAVEDARLAIRAVDPNDLALARTALSVLELLPESDAILDAFHLRDEGTVVTLENDVFELVCDALERKLDAVATSFLCAWGFEAAEAIDVGLRPGEVFLRPHLRVRVDEDSPSGHRRRWIRVMACLDPDSLLAEASRIAGNPALAQELAGALEAVGSIGAQAALAELARDHYITVGYRALEALANLGAVNPLVRISQDDLPPPYREMAVRFLGGELGGLCIEELADLALRCPEPSIRKLAFRYLSTHDDPEAIASLSGGVADPALRPLALQWLHRLSAEQAVPIALTLLDHPDRSVRSHATELLSAVRDEGGLVPVAMRLLSKNALTRDAALAVLVWREELSSVTVAAARILHTPGVVILQERGTPIGETGAPIGETGETPPAPSAWYLEVRSSSARLLRNGNDGLRRWSRWVLETPAPQDSDEAR